MKPVWLGLRVEDAPLTLLRVAIPKQTVRSAVRRNRIRRLIREAARKDPRLGQRNKRYTFFVRSAPDRPDLKMVLATIQTLLGDFR